LRRTSVRIRPRAPALAVRWVIAVKAVRHVAGMVLALLCFVTPAYALSGSTLLGFLDYYVAPDGAQCQHRGIDIALPVGAEIGAPISGRVRFAGRVPGPHGGSVIAVSVETDSGIVSMLPLSDVAVVAGEHIEKGMTVGRLAAEGDPSSEATHLHLGFKRGSVYVDPSFLLEAAAASSPQQPAPEPAPIAGAAPSPVTSPVTPATAPAPGVPAGAPAHAPAGAPVAVPAGGSAALPDGGGATVRAAKPDPLSGTQPAGDAAGGHVADPAVSPGESTALLSAEGLQGRIVSAGVHELAPGVTVVGTQATPAPLANAAAIGTRAQPEGSGTSVSAADRASASQLVAARGVSGYAVAACAAALFGALLLLTRRTLARRIVGSSPVSDRLGILLQHLKAGDTLCGLTSCSGHAAFTVPGPLAQRR
jgi:murein DD-endopeptidase MepM/ murein hydrolase activator NlpD